MNSYLKVDMQLSIMIFATLANFLQPVGRKDTDVDRGFHLPTFFYLLQKPLLEAL
jgi:hypothetical protein